MNHTHLHPMKVALHEAETAQSRGDWPIGCAIVLDGKIISTGSNRVFSEQNKLFHAEIEAMNSAKEILNSNRNKAILYVTYEPCPMCVMAAIHNHVSTIVTGPDLDGSGGLYLLSKLPERFRNQAEQITIVKNVLDEDCIRIFMSGKPTKERKHLFVK